MSLASRLRHRVTIQTATDTPDGSGGYTRSWADVTTVWAEVLPTGGREAVIAGALKGVQNYKVTVRHSPTTAAVTVRNRFVWGSVYLDIQSIADPDGRREALVAFCSSGETDSTP